MWNILYELRDDERGAAAIEYGLIAALVSAAAIAALIVTGEAVDGLISTIAGYVALPD